MNTAQIIKSSEYTGHRKGNPVHHLFSYCMNTRGATADFVLQTVMLPGLRGESHQHERP